MVVINPNDIDSSTPANIGPFEVEIWPDTGAENPWESCDCMTPLLWASLRDCAVETHDSGDGIEDFFTRVSPGFVSRHWREICEILDVDPGDHDRQAREGAEAWGASLGEARIDLFRAALDDMKPYFAGAYARRAKDYFDALAALYGLAGTPALSTTVTGYAQGDAYDLLLVATREHAARCGYNFRNPRFDVRASLENDAEIFECWAFGDVWGWSVSLDGEIVESCGGYVERYWERGGALLLDAAAAVEAAAKRLAGESRDQESRARAAYLRLRREWRIARKQAGALASGAICEALDRRSREILAEWRAARKLRRECAAVAAAWK